MSYIYNRNRVAAATTKREWQTALNQDEKMLVKLRQDIEKLRKGDQVENLVLTEAEDVEQGLEQAIANKKRLISML